MRGALLDRTAYVVFDTPASPVERCHWWSPTALLATAQDDSPHPPTVPATENGGKSTTNMERQRRREKLETNGLRQKCKTVRNRRTPSTRGVAKGGVAQSKTKRQKLGNTKKNYHKRQKEVTRGLQRRRRCRGGQEGQTNEALGEKGSATNERRSHSLPTVGKLQQMLLTHLAMDNKDANRTSRTTLCVNKTEHRRWNGLSSQALS